MREVVEFALKMSWVHDDDHAPGPGDHLIGEFGAPAIPWIGHVRSCHDHGIRLPGGGLQRAAHGSVDGVPTQAGPRMGPTQPILLGAQLLGGVATGCRDETGHGARGLSQRSC